MAGSNHTIDYSLAAALNAGGLKWLSVNLSADAVRDGFSDPVTGVINYTERLVGDVIDPVFSGTVYDLSDNFTIRVTVDGGDPFAPAYANIVTGDGADTIVLVIDPGPATAFADIDSGGGDDTITVSNNWYGTIIGGSGQDTLTFSGTCGISLAGVEVLEFSGITDAGSFQSSFYAGSSSLSAITSIRFGSPAADVWDVVYVNLDTSVFTISRA